MSMVNPIEEFKKKHLDKAKKKSIEVQEFTTSFRKQFPIESIKEMSLEDYLYVPYDEYNPSTSFCSRIWRETYVMFSKGDSYTNEFGIYELNNKIAIHGKYLEDFGDNISAAFSYLKDEIYTLLKEVENDNYEAAVKCPINRGFRDQMLAVYFPDKFIHVHTESMLNHYCECVGLKVSKKDDTIYRNLALRAWRDSVPELKDWDNSVIMSFCDWLYRSELTIDGSALAIDCEQYAEEIDEEIDDNIIDGYEKEAIVKQRVNQGVFRDLLFKRYNKCVLCGVSHKNLLRASHIKPWSESKKKEKLDIDNGFLMCPNHDRLFDQGWITFDDNGKIIISNNLNPVDRMYMNVNEDMLITLTEGNKGYLKYHREWVFEKVINEYS